MNAVDPLPSDVSSWPGDPIGAEQALDACHDGAVLLCVNRRLSRELSGRYERWRVERGDAWWATPQILPLGRWLEGLHAAAVSSGQSDRVALPPLRAQRRWQRLIEADPAVSPLSPLATARHAVRAWNLAHGWQVLPDIDEGYLPPDQYHFAHWAHRYAGQLEAGGQVDAATLPAHVIELMREGSLSLPRRVVYAGYLQLSAQVMTLLHALQGAGVTVQRLADGPAAVPRTVRWQDDAAELAGVAAEVHARLQAQPDAVLGVVVPDLDVRRAQVLRAFDARFFPTLSPVQIERIGRPYDLSIGQPLASVPVVRAALTLLQLCVHGLEQPWLSALITSPYLGAHAAECRHRERIDRRWREQRRQRLDLDGLVPALGSDSALQAPLFRIAREVRAWRRTPSTSAEWAQRFTATLRAFGWASEGMGLDSEEHQAVQAWHGTLDDLQALDDGEALSSGRAFSLLRDLASQRVFQPEVAERPIRILGRLESHGLRFDALWLTGLDSDRWPPAGSPSPFLSMVRQKRAGMPEASAVARLALARCEFAHGCSAAPTVTASCVAERDGQPLEVASVLDTAALEVLQPAPLDAHDPPRLIHEAIRIERVADARGPALGEREQGKGGASLFRDQAECAFRAFATHRLRIRPLEEVGGGIDRRQAGNVLHRSLELFWSELRTHAALMALDEAALETAVHDAVRTALAEEVLGETWRALEHRRLVALLHEWIEVCEKPREPFEIVAWESGCQTRRGGVEITLKIDRMDRLLEPGDALQRRSDAEAGEARLPGRRVVLDYKTGKRETIAGWEQARIANPQLPLYALTDERIVAVGYAQVVARKCRYKGIGEQPGLLRGLAGDADEDGWQARRAHWREALDAAGEAFAAGEATVLPVAKACEWCELRALCRIDAGCAVGDEEPGGDGTFEQREAPEER